MLAGDVWVWALCVKCGCQYQFMATAYTTKIHPRCWGCGEVPTFAGEGVTTGGPTVTPQGCGDPRCLCAGRGVLLAHVRVVALPPSRLEAPVSACRGLRGGVSWHGHRPADSQRKETRK